MNTRRTRRKLQQQPSISTLNEETEVKKFSGSKPNLLPPEILSFIFEYMDGMGSRLKAGLVCRAWRYALVSNRSSWKKISFVFDRSMIVDSNNVKGTNNNNDNDNQEDKVLWSQRKLSLFRQRSHDTIDSIRIDLCGNDAKTRRLLLCTPNEYSERKTRAPLYDNLQLILKFMREEHVKNGLVRLHINVDIYEFKNLSPILHNFPQLEYLYLVSYIRSKGHYIYPPCSPHHSLRLNRLTLVNFYPILFNGDFFFENLEFLTLQQASIHFLNYIIIITNRRQLPSNTAVFPSLRVLELLDDEEPAIINSDIIFGLNNMPALEHLYLRDFLIDEDYLRNRIQENYLSDSPIDPTRTLQSLKRLSIINCLMNFFLLWWPQSESRPLCELEIGDTKHYYSNWTEWYPLLLKQIPMCWPNITLLKLWGATLTLNKNDDNGDAKKFIDKLDDVAPRLHTLEFHASSVSCACIVRLVKKRLSNRSDKAIIKKLVLHSVNDSKDIKSLSWLEANVPNVHIAEWKSLAYCTPGLDMCSTIDQ